MKSGRRLHVIPGARILCTVAMKFTPVRIDENPMMKAPSTMGMTHEFVSVEYGV